MYADDTKILAWIRKNFDEVTQKKQEDINKDIQVTNTWLMSQNLSKCKFMHIGSKNKCSSDMMKSNDKEESLPFE